MAFVYEPNITDDERVKDRRDLARMAEMSSDELDLSPYERSEYFMHKPKGATMDNSTYHRLAKKTVVPITWRHANDYNSELSDYRKTKRDLDREETIRKGELRDTMTEVLTNKGIDPYMHRKMMQYIQDPASNDPGFRSLTQSGPTGDDGNDPMDGRGTLIGAGRGMSHAGHHLKKGWHHPLVMQ